MKNNFLKIAVYIFMGFISFSCADLTEDEEVGTVDIENLIQKESELFGLIERVAETDAEDEITCIKFLYSFTLLEFDANLLPIAEHVVSSDPQFSSILDGIGIGNSIGISFPIQSILDNGDEFLIQNKDELKQAIDDCILVQQDQIAGNCRIIQEECVWVVSHTDTDDTYENAVFDIASDGTLKFYNNGIEYEGTRIVYFIEDELHTNISINDMDTTGQDWNFDWKTQVLSNDEMTFTNDAGTFLLTKECDEENYCTTLVFVECETIDGSEISEFIFEDYIPCIIQLNDLDELTIDDTIAFYETAEDANNQTNPLSITSYQNIATVQIIYVRIDYAMSTDFILMPIEIQSISC